MKLACRAAWFLLLFGSSILADVNYDIVQSAKAFPAAIDSATSWTSSGIFAISPNIYAPAADATTREVTHVHIKGHKMLLAGARTSQIFDLDAATVTTIDFNAHTFKTEALAPQQFRLDPQVSVRKTGKTVLLYGQQSTEYEVVASGARPRAAHSVAPRLLCWVADRTPSAELDEFAKAWYARTNAPFVASIVAPKMLLSANLHGYVMGFITESSTRKPTLDLTPRPSQTYNAYYTALPSVRTIVSANTAAPAVTYDSFTSEYSERRLVQYNLMNFTTSSADENSFLIPPAFKKKR